MKTKQLKRYFLSIAITAFLVLLAGNAFAGVNATRSPFDGDGNYANNYIVASPYWQVDNGSYTFIAVSHSSLSGMASQIGLTINAITSAGSAYDTAETFTVQAGTTTRVFIVPTTHSTINPTAVSAAKFLQGTSDFTYGHIRVNPQTSHPMMKEGGILDKFAPFVGAGFRDITLLTYWGSVIIEANTTGFAMEFIGDMNDSSAAAVTADNVSATQFYGASGVNGP